MEESGVLRHFGRGLSGLVVGLIAFGAGSLAGGCQNSGRGQPDRATQSVRARLTATGSTGAASQDQAKADAFSQQAGVYATLAAGDRAQAAALSAAIAAEAGQAAAAPPLVATAQPVASAGAASAVTMPASAVASGTVVASAGVPPAAEKLESHYQKVAALADRLGANAQRLATFHLARVSALSGVAGARGAR